MDEMPEQHTDLFDGHTVEQQLHSESIAEAMRVGVFHAGDLGHFPEHAAVSLTQRFF
jgi:hypothetical protein